MENDLNLSQALGGLRIANPDDASSPPPSQDTHQAPREQQPVSVDTQVSSGNAAAHQSNGALPQLETSSPSHPPTSSLDFDPNSYTIDTKPTEKPAQPQISPVVGKQPSQRKSNRQSTALPLTYQGQQQAQFPQYPSVISPNERTYKPSARPTSMLPPQPQTSSPLPARDGSYRLHKETSQTSLSGSGRRQATRAAAAAMQAGVPTREHSHSERTYRGSQSARVNGPLPPRRSSRGPGTTPIGGPGMNAYGMEHAPLPVGADEWRERGAASGVRQETDANGQTSRQSIKKGVNDFHFGKTLGEGSYSTVVLGTDRQTGKDYAMKVLDKRHIIKEKKVKYVNIERDTLNRLTEHPGVVRLFYTFQDERSLYFVLDLATGGELLGVLKRMTTFDEECTRFYGAQILDTIDYMHSRGVIHRDLKPENVLMDANMHIKITDFGTAKILDTTPRQSNNSTGVPLPGQTDEADENRANSFVGTAEYVSPELLTEKNAGKASDLWAFGCIIYQLLAGRPPFKAANEYLTFQKIIHLDYAFPSGFPMVARDLVERLLVLDPSRRLTMDHVKNHEFFDGIRWGKGLWQQTAPRLRSFDAPAPAPIKLNGGPGVQDTANANYPDTTPAHSTRPVHISTGGNENGAGSSSRPKPRVITELPPPSQLDIEWSPILTKNNERILKLGNQLVTTTPAATSPSNKDGKEHKQNAEGSKFSRFFGGGGTTKKRQRLVMVTSSGRVLIAPASGDEKKVKFEVSILADGSSWKKLQDSKGLSYWVIDTREKHFVFEDPKASSSDGSATSAAAQEWLEAVERGREIAISQSMTASYSGDDAFRDLQSPSSSANTMEPNNERHNESVSASSSRHTLHKYPSSTNPEELRGFKRFSKRQSKSGLAAVF